MVPVRTKTPVKGRSACGALWLMPFLKIELQIHQARKGVRANIVIGLNLSRNLHGILTLILFSLPCPKLSAYCFVTW